jgi:hydroxypyruvate reductase
LVISDVLGNRLDLVASGPTAPEEPAPQAALEVLSRFRAEQAGIAPAVFEYLRAECRMGRAQRAPPQESAPIIPTGGARCARPSLPEFHHVVIGENATAVAAAAEEARRLGYDVSAESASHSEGQAEEVGRWLAETALRIAAGGAGSAGGAPVCYLSGGEPVVTLVDPARRGRGGRNQQLVLAALLRLMGEQADGIALLSGGSDGEDGPTDAAGAVLDANVLAAARQAGRDPADYLARNDAYGFFDPLGALLKTGPTQTNVCDLRVVLAVSPTTTGPWPGSA